MTSEIRPPAPANFIGLQDGFGDPPIELFTLTEQVGEHPARSTVSRQTLERHGFAVPLREELMAALARLPRPHRTLATANGFGF
jgi:hypothetical protein